MAKMITRSVIRYKYTFIKTSKDEGGKLVVEDTKEVTFNDRMGARKVAVYIKENPELTGYMIGSVEEVEQKYGMTLESFLANAELIID